MLEKKLEAVALVEFGKQVVEGRAGEGRRRQREQRKTEVQAIVVDGCGARTVAGV